MWQANGLLKYQSLPGPHNGAALSDEAPAVLHHFAGPGEMEREVLPAFMNAGALMKKCVWCSSEPHRLQELPGAGEAVGATEDEPLHVEGFGLGDVGDEVDNVRQRARHDLRRISVPTCR